MRARAYPSLATLSVLLAACGGGSSKSSGGAEKQQTSSLVAQPVDMTKQARRGGSMKYSISADIPNFDAHILSRTDAADFGEPDDRV